MQTLVAAYRGLCALLRLHFDWMRFAMIVLVALHIAAYVMLR